MLGLGDGLAEGWDGHNAQPRHRQLPHATAAAVVACAAPLHTQGIGISAINSMGKISDPEDGKALQNFMICCEMAIAGIALLYAFPHKEYQIGGSTSGWKLGAFTHAISINDVVKDAIHVVSGSLCAGATPPPPAHVSAAY